MTLPKITVVTPSYNQGEFLRETIESVLNQNYPHLEYFVVDGGSTDGSVELIRQYEARIAWWVSENDNGQSDALRKGFERATGQLLAWLNSDDVYFPNALNLIAHAYERDPNATLYVGGLAVGGYNNGPIRKCAVPPPPWGYLPRFGRFVTSQQSTFFDANAYRLVGGIDVNKYMRMDADLIYRMLMEKKSIVRVKEIVSFIRWHSETKTTSDKGVDIYWQELEEFIQSLTVPRWQYQLALSYMRFVRLISGSYIESLWQAYRLRKYRMTDVWNEYWARQGLRA